MLFLFQMLMNVTVMSVHIPVMIRLVVTPVPVSMDLN